MARRSDDPATAEEGGVMGQLALGQLLPEYLKAILPLKAGEFSRPFQTQYGWHIVKLLSRDTLPPKASMVPFYKTRLARDSRGMQSHNVFVGKCIKRYGIVDYTATPKPQPKGRRKKGQPEMAASLQPVASALPDSIFAHRWDSKAYRVESDQPLLLADGINYYPNDLIDFMGRNQTLMSNVDIDMNAIVGNYYKAFIDSVAIRCADRHLEEENPEFAAIVDDYRRGLMIFNYNEKMVWSKAMHDSAGYAAFYEAESAKKSLSNPDDSIYFWKTRARVVVINVADSAALPPAKASKLLAKALKKDATSTAMRDQLRKKVAKGHDAGSVTNYVDVVEQGRKGSSVTPAKWERGVYGEPSGKGYRMVVVQEVIPPTLKSRSEARGYYLNAYQNEVERQLNADLQRKYHVVIHRDVVNSITF